MTARHRSGKFKARPAREAAPLCVAVTKSERVAKGNRTRAREHKDKVRAVAVVLRAEVEAGDPFAVWMAPFL